MRWLSISYRCYPCDPWFNSWRGWVQGRLGLAKAKPIIQEYPHQADRKGTGKQPLWAKEDPQGRADERSPADGEGPQRPVKANAASTHFRRNIGGDHRLAGRFADLTQAVD